MADALTKSGKGVLPDGKAEPTVAFYDADPESYAKSTLSSDLSNVYPFFLERVADGGLILDAGCGAGRDILEFLKRGYRVEAFDASVGLASFAKRLTGASVEVARFEDWKSREGRYDGIWCFASLLHVARENLPKVLTSLVASLKPGAPLFASFKWGECDTIDERGREFTNFTPEGVRRIFRGVEGLTGVEVRFDEGPTAFEDRTRWIYVLATRTT